MEREGRPHRSRRSNFGEDGEANRRRARTLNHGYDDNSKSIHGLPVRSIGIGVCVVFCICCLQFMLLTRNVEVSGPGRLDPTWMRHETNLTILAEQQRQLSVLTAQLSSNLQREHNALAQVKDQMNGQLSNMQAASFSANTDSGLRETQVRQEQELQDQRNSISQLTQTIGDFKMKLEELRAAESRTEDALRAQEAASAQRAAIAQQSAYAQQSENAHRTEEWRDPGASRARPEAPKNSDPAYDTVEFPADWLKTRQREELVAAAKEAEKWLHGVKAMFKHAWKGYRERAWGQDEMRPVSGTPGRRWANCGLQILDALSTIWIMGMQEEFDEAERWVTDNLRFDSPGLVSVFEINIRALAGLASAHSLSGREIFLKRAKELADRLMPAFSDDPGFPSTQVDLVTGARKHGWYQGTILSEAGTLQLEFRYISQQTGDPKYGEKADKSMRAILAAAKGRGLVPWGLNRVGPPHFQNTHITFGAMGDSYYEYLLKVYLQTAKTETVWKDSWKQAMAEMQSRLVLKTRGGLRYVAEENNGRQTHKMDHLACFVGGMLVYGAHTLPSHEVDQAWEINAAGITETCYQMYHRQPSHLSPECVALRPDQGPGQDMAIWNNAAHYLLRPEAAEAIFYMHYYTGDPKYRRWAGEIFEAIEQHARTTWGYSAVSDVRSPQPRQKNEMETFFIAETLKYLYLTFVPNPRAVVDLDEFVFNTEAHPLRIFRDGKRGGFLGRDR